MREFTMSQQTSDFVSALKHAIIAIKAKMIIDDAPIYKDILKTYNSLLNKIEEENLDIRLVSREY